MPIVKSVRRRLQVNDADKFVKQHKRCNDQGLNVTTQYGGAFFRNVVDNGSADDDFGVGPRLFGPTKRRSDVGGAGLEEQNGAASRRNRLKNAFDKRLL